MLQACPWVMEGVLQVGWGGGAIHWLKHIVPPPHGASAWPAAPYPLLNPLCNSLPYVTPVQGVRLAGSCSSPADAASALAPPALTLSRIHQGLKVHKKAVRISVERGGMYVCRCVHIH